MSCKHKPIFKFSQLFARSPKHICQKCGAKIQLTPRFQTGLKAANALFIMIILFRAFSNNDADPSVEKFLINMAILFGMAAVYFLVIVLIVIYGPYEEIYEETEDADEQAQADNVIESETNVEQVEQTAEKSENAQSEEYTDEQRQLVEMYAAYEKLAEEKQRAEADKPAKPSKPLPEMPACQHEVVPSWKNYIPSKMDFVCKNCGEQITFSASRKRSINLIFLAVMAIILMPNFMNDEVNFWQYLLITLGALVVATLIQVYFVKRWPMELKQTQ